MQKIQYYASDLAYILDIGEIADMHVETTESGRQVLRITCMEKKEDEYKTIKAKPERQATKKPKHTTGPGPSRQPEPRSQNPEKLGDKLMAGAKTWFNKKDKPQFMKDAGF